MNPPPLPKRKENTVLVLSVCIIIAVAVCWSVRYAVDVTKENDLRQRQAIERVIVKDAVLYAQHKRAFGYDFDGYAEAVQKIKFQDCPQDFRAAWLEFIQSCERASAQNLAGAITYGWKLAVQTMARDSKRATQTLSENDRVRESWYAVERVAVRYGAQINIDVSQYP